MKQIVVNADPETHAWIAELAATEKRSMGNQVLAMLGIIRSKCRKPSRRTQNRNQ